MCWQEGGWLRHRAADLGLRSRTDDSSELRARLAGDKLRSSEAWRNRARAGRSRDLRGRLSVAALPYGDEAKSVWQRNRQCVLLGQTQEWQNRIQLRRSAVFRVSAQSPAAILGKALL